MKAFYALSVLLRDDAATAQLEKALQGLQAFEDSLPYEPHKTVCSDTPGALHEALAAKMRAQQKYRYTIVKYAALGE